MQNYYIIDDQRLGPAGFLKRGWTIQRFSALEEAGAVNKVPDHLLRAEKWQ